MKQIHRLHSAALAAKQTQLSALPLRSLRLCGVPWAVPNTQPTMCLGRFFSGVSLVFATAQGTPQRRRERRGNAESSMYRAQRLSGRDTRPITYLIARAV